MPISVTVKALEPFASGDRPAAGPRSRRSTNFVIAPVDAPGKIVYWALAGGLGSLKGFGIGEEGVENVLVPSQVAARRPDQETCIGCHSATPDGNAVGFALGQGLYLDSIADIRTGPAREWCLRTSPPRRSPPSASSRGPRPTRRRTGATATASWSSATPATCTGSSSTATGQGIVARKGDVRQATAPTFRHDGKGIVYVSTQLDRRSAVRRRVQAISTRSPTRRARAAPPSPLPGAADPGYTEYYPALSPDDAFIAFTRIEGAGNVYSVTEAEVFVVPSRRRRGASGWRPTTRRPARPISTALA